MLLFTLLKRLSMHLTTFSLNSEIVAVFFICKVLLFRRLLFFLSLNLLSKIILLIWMKSKLSFFLFMILVTPKISFKNSKSDFFNK